MGFEMPKEKFGGQIKEVAIGATKEDGGTRRAKVIAGGSNGLPFHRFEGEPGRMPLIAMDVVDTMRMVPERLQETMGPSLADPAEWAKTCETDWGADLCVLKLASANPEEEDRSAEELESLVSKVLQSTALPLTVYGCGFEEKDAKVMEKVSNVAKGERLFLGLAEEKAYKSLAAASMANGHGIVAFSNLDINLAKQMNILLLDFGMKPENILMDPLMAPLGMGLEYSYSNIERLRLGALSGDPVLQMPMICDCSCAWNVPEALEDNPDHGGAKMRGIYWEAITGLSAAVAGAGIVIMRHPESVKMLRDTLKSLTGGD